MATLYARDPLGTYKQNRGGVAPVCCQTQSALDPRMQHATAPVATPDIHN